MKMKTLLTSGVVLLGFAMLFTACKKDDDDQPVTNSTKILGTWKQLFDATDANSNNMLDASEKDTLDAGDFDYYTFYNNGTFRDSFNFGGVSATIPGTWTINGEYITLTVLGSSDVAKFVQLDNTTLIVEDTAANPASWLGFTKQ